MLLAALLLQAAAPAPPAAPARRAPNLVLILADDLGYGDVSCYGGTALETPNVDRLAARGVRFTDGYVPSSECAPSRAGLLTGRYPQRSRFRTNADARLGLPAGEVTLGEALREAGYRTGVFGKWHLGTHPEQRPLRRGFDEFLGFLAGAHSYRQLAVADQPTNPIWRGDEEVDAEGYLTDLLTDAAVDFVERHAAVPFFLYVPYSAPHIPLEAPDGWEVPADATREERQASEYRGLVASLDRGVGRILDALARLGLEPDTLVVFLSDNGGAESTPSSNGPFRGSKRDLWEGGLRIPFVVSWPGVVPEGVVSHEPVISLDLFPTFLAAAGATWPEDRPALDGVDLLPHLTGAESGPVHEALHWMNHDEWAVRRGPWKLVVRDKRVRHLSNLAVDPAEEEDLLGKNRDRFNQLQRLHEAWEATLPPPLFRPEHERQRDDR